MVDVAVHQGSGAVYTLYQTRYVNKDVGGWSQDVYLRRYKRDKTVLWQRQLGNSNIDSANALATDSSGNICVSRNDKLEKRRPNGAVVWNRTVSDAADETLVVTDLATDAGNNVHFVGYNDSYKSVILIKYTGAGSVSWARGNASDASSFVPAGLATDANNNVDLLTNTLDDAFAYSTLYKYRSDNKRLFVKIIDDGSNNVRLEGLGVRGDAVYVAGSLLDDGLGSDAFVAKLSLSGTERGAGFSAHRTATA